MNLRDALDVSNCGMAEMRSMRTTNRHVAMKTSPSEVRIVKAFTDPTVIRRLRLHEIESKDWEPLNENLHARFFAQEGSQ